VTTFKDMSGASVQPDLADDRPREAAGFISTALPGESICEGWVTSYEVVDKVGDIGTFGMFAATLKKFREKGKRIPVTEAHDWSSQGIIGYVMPDEIVEVPRGGPGGKGGLFARMHLLTDDSRAAKFLYRLMQDLPLQMSYAFDSVSEKRDPKSKANRLYSVQLLEVTICLFGAVEATSVRARKQREAIARMPEYKAWVKREKNLRDVDLMTAIVDQDRPNRRSVKKPGYDPVADFEALCLSKGWPLDDEPSAVVGPDYSQGRCPKCQTFITLPPKKNPGGFGYLHNICPKCSTVLLDYNDTKSLTRRQVNAEETRIETRMKDAVRNAQMKAELDRAMQRQEIDALLKFATAKPVTKTDYRAEVAALTADITPKKKSTTDPLDGMTFPTGRGRAHI
jgi:HK97 family phage prohead protease